MFRYINMRNISSSKQAVLYNCRGHKQGNYCVTYMGMDHFFPTRSKAVAWREAIR